MSKLNLPASDYYETPNDLFTGLNEIFAFDIDLCATAQNAKLPKFFTEDDNALVQDWYKRGCAAFANPPFSTQGKKDEFISKALEEATLGVTTVMVLPVKTDTGAFHDYIQNRFNVSYYFLRGRPRFNLNGKPTQNTGRSATMIVVFWAHGSNHSATEALVREFCKTYRQSKRPRVKKEQVNYVYEDLPEVKYQSEPWIEPPAVCEFHTSLDRCKQYHCPPFNK